MRWSGRWTSVDLKFSGFKGYPGLEFLFGTHFGGLKPWNFNNRSIRAYAKFPDFQLWFRRYRSMLEDHPDRESAEGHSFAPRALRELFPRLEELCVAVLREPPVPAAHVLAADPRRPDRSSQ